VATVELSRRDFLASLLGLPLALSACRKPAPAPIAGTMRGASDALGHRLRTEARSEPSGERQRVRVAIVGGGPSGLSAAWRLERLGLRDYVVFDLEAKVGGTSSFGDDGVVPYPWGAHYLPAPDKSNRALTTLLNELGVISGRDEASNPSFAEEQLVRAPEERLFYQGRWYEGLYPRAGASREDSSELARFHREIDAWVAFRDARGRRAFTLPMAQGSDDAEVTALDRISMEAWLDAKGLTSPRLRWLVDYACRDDYGLLAKHTSAWAGIFYFASRMKAPGEEAADLLTWSHGNGRLVEHLARAAEGRIRERALVTEIVPRDDHVELTVFDARAGELRGITAEYVIFACPKFLARHLVRPYRESPPTHLREFEYGAWMVANLHLRTRPGSRGFPMAWDNVLYDSPSLGYVVATHQRYIDYGPTVWTYYLPLTDEDPRVSRERLLAAGHAEWVDAIVADLGRAHVGLEGALERVDVSRWGHAMVRPRPGFMWGGARAKAAEPLGRVHFAHSDLSGLALFEEAQHRGIAAAEAIARRLGWTGESVI
jgi:protoporphyrinogen oxidase